MMALQVNVNLRSVVIWKKKVQQLYFVEIQDRQQLVSDFILIFGVTVRLVHCFLNLVLSLYVDKCAFT